HGAGLDLGSGVNSTSLCPARGGHAVSWRPRRASRLRHGRRPCLRRPLVAGFAHDLCTRPAVDRGHASRPLIAAGGEFLTEASPRRTRLYVNLFTTALAFCMLLMRY